MYLQITSINWQNLQTFEEIYYLQWIIIDWTFYPSFFDFVHVDFTFHCLRKWEDYIIFTTYICITPFWCCTECMFTILKPCWNMAVELVLIDKLIWKFKKLTSAFNGNNNSNKYDNKYQIKRCLIQDGHKQQQRQTKNNIYSINNKQQFKNSSKLLFSIPIAKTSSTMNKKI